jgi:hypothetical protein
MNKSTHDHAVEEAVGTEASQQEIVDLSFDALDEVGGGELFYQY